MTERLADVSQRIGTTRQLGAVVNAMRGIAGARATQSRALLPAIRAYAEIAARAIGQARLLTERATIERAPAPASGKPGLLVFGAEQGFAGAFVEQVLDATAAAFADAHVFLIGSRSAALAAERGLAVAWTTALPGHASAVPDTAAAIVDALYAYLGEVGALPVTMVYPVWTAGSGVVTTHRALLPFDQTAFPSVATANPPLIDLPVGELLTRLGEEYVFALVCGAAMEAFAAENEARMTTMAAAKTNIDGKLTALQALERRIRQEEVTAEVIELAAGARVRNRGP